MKSKLFKKHPSGLWVSRDGEVFVSATKGHYAHFTFGCDNGHGYLQVIRNGKRYSVHRLVAECFIPNPNNYPQVNHIDEDKSNNRVENLEWCDRKYNCNYGTRNERSAKARSKLVNQYSLDGKLVKVWPSVIDVERSLGYGQGNISACCLGKFKTAYKYIWKYA